MSRRRHTTPDPSNGEARDEGSALILVLLMVALASLLILPMLDYAMTISRQNTVLSTKTKRQEAVKAGLRTALADPSKLYTYCGEEGAGLAGPGIDDIDIETDCRFIDSAFADVDEELHLGLVVTRVGETIPSGLEAILNEDADGNTIDAAHPDWDPAAGTDALGRYIYAPSTADPAEWLDSIAPYAPSAVPQPKRIWLPNLPVHSVNLRGSSGFQMADGYPTCRVFFPGTYRDPLVLDGPTYFTSGVYYFQNTVTVAAGADVVVGMGRHPGCTTDQEAVFYATNAPAVHTISGLGATFVFGHNAVGDTDGRLIVTNADGSAKIRFNQRYVAEEDTGGQPSFGVSIMSVNGVAVGGPDANGEYQLDDLDVPGVNKVPASMVGIQCADDPEELAPPCTPPASAGEHKLQPSKLTHEPRRPTKPLWDASQPLIALRAGPGTNEGAVRVRWQEPEQLGGLPVDEYVVTASPGGRSCVSTGPALECVVTGLTIGTPYRFTVTAESEAGVSEPSDASAPVTPTNGSPEAGAPAAPAAPSVVRHADDTVVVSWTAPADNNVPITGYTVSADPAAGECVMLPETTSCMIRGLEVLHPAVPADPDDPDDPGDPGSDYVFQVIATNELGDSAPSPQSATGTLIPSTPDPSPADPPADPLVVVEPYEPLPIVDINLPATNSVVVDIPGYISVPQGIVRVHNPNGLGTGDSTVALTGGIVAAAFSVEDGRSVDGELTVPIGLVNPIVQRTFLITSSTGSGTPKVTGTAIVQINQNGAYAVNSWIVQS